MILRVVGWILLLIAAAFLGRDLVLLFEGAGWTPILAGQVWFWIHKDSLLLLQPAIERYLWPPLWSVIAEILTWPAWVVLGVPGLLLSLAGRRRRKKRWWR